MSETVEEATHPPAGGGNFTSEASSQATGGSDFISKASGKGEDVKKSLQLLSEVRLSPREVKPCGFVFFAPRAKNWRREGD